MPLSPAPLMPGSSPLPEAGRRPPDKRALRIGAFVALPILILGLVIGRFALTPLLFLTAGLESQASANSLQGSSAALFQGFTFNWTRNLKGGGYATPASLKNMESQVQLFHMNAVIIPVVADMPQRSESELDWHSTDANDLHTLPESDYIQAIKDARKAGLIPILALEVLQQDSISSSDSPQFVGAFWSGLPADASTATLSVGQLERGWFNNYTAFAVHYAAISQRFHLPYFIIGDSLTDVSYDTDRTQTGPTADPNGATETEVPGESFPKCLAIGRRDCEWRHVIHAIRSSSYDTFDANQSQTGASYTGKLIYLANSNGSSDGDAATPEYQGITWWDAVDYIGIDAYFPLTANNADVDVNTLVQAWHGQGTGLGLIAQGIPRSQANIYSNIQAVSQKFNRPVIFQAGYASSSGANNDPENLSGGSPDGGADNQEQLNDMQALLQTFNGAPWWEGVFWNGDEPQTPRTAQSSWTTNSNWAGDTLATSKLAGQYLNKFYQPAPLQCSC